jgi:hypothetical protein
MLGAKSSIQADTDSFRTDQSVCGESRAFFMHPRMRPTRLTCSVSLVECRPYRQHGEVFPDVRAPLR